MVYVILPQYILLYKYEYIIISYESYFRICVEMIFFSPSFFLAQQRAVTGKRHAQYTRKGPIQHATHSRRLRQRRG